MKLQHILFTLMLVCVTCFAVLVSSAKSEEYVWKDGFLEKSYQLPAKDVGSAISLLFGFVVKEGVGYGDCLVLGIEKLEKENGSIVTYGVGDKNGRCGNWKGVGTVEGLNIKDGGSAISVKVIEKDSITTVGFKVDDGDRKTSEKLHELMLQKLAKSTPKPCN